MDAAVGDRIEFRIASGHEWVHYDAVVTEGPVTRDAPVGWPQPTITTVTIGAAERTDGSVHTFTGTRIQVENIIAVHPKEGS